MVKIKRALISVSDKAGVVDFAAELHNLGVEILSTGGTAKALREAKIPVIEVSDYTGFPEMLDGRVKTLHPKIHGGLLALRDNPKHIESLKEHTIGLIDMVVVNLYPFEKTTQKPGVSIEEVIENIDIKSNIISSQVKLHAKYGGVYPELASREHIKNILPVIEKALSEASIKHEAGIEYLVSVQRRRVQNLSLLRPLRRARPQQSSEV